MPDDLKHLIESTAVETRRHFDNVAERLDKKIDAVAESVVTLDQKLNLENRAKDLGIASYW